MSTQAQYASTPIVGTGLFSTADTSLLTPSNTVTILTAGTNGTRIDYIEAVGLATTSSNLLNLFIYDGTNYNLWQQIPIQAATANTTTPAYQIFYSSNSNANQMPLVIPTGYSLRGTLSNNSILYNEFYTSIGASQAVSSGAYALLNGTVFGTGTGGSGVAPSTTAIASAATVSSTYFTLSSTPYVMSTPMQLTLTSSGNQSAISFVVHGTDATGASITETITGPNATTVYSTNVYATVTSVYSNASMTGTTSVGYSGAISFAVPLKINQVSGSTSNTGVSWSIVGINSGGTLTTETLTGAGIGLVVNSTNTYRSITSIKASAAATAASFGNPITFANIRVNAYGGSF
jgi:hypothetical protein